MQLKITDQTPAVGVAAHPGSDVTFQLTIKKVKKINAPTVIESCDGNRLVVSARRNDIPGTPASFLLGGQFQVTSVAFGGGLWSRPGFAMSDGRFWGINVADLEAFHTPLVPEFEQTVTIAVTPTTPAGVYPICFGLGIGIWNEPYSGQTGGYIGSDDEDGRLDNNIDCRQLIVEPRSAGACNDGCCDCVDDCLFSLPQFIDGCLLTLETFFLVLLILLVLIFLLLFFRR